MVAVVAVSQWIGYANWAPVAILQSLTPWLAVAGVVIAGAATATDRFVLAGSAVLAIAALVPLLAPVLTRTRTPHIPDDAARLTVVHANLLWSNERDSAAAMSSLLAHDADVLVLHEFTRLHRADLIDLLDRLDLDGGTRYPHRAERPDRGPHGIGVWSRHPLRDTVFLPSDTRLGLVTCVDIGGQLVRIVAVHPPPPMNRRALRGWRDGLRAIEHVAAQPGPPTMIVGDFNAARWHPPFRRLLHRWTDAHESLGKPWGGTWPTDRRLVPPFVRIDHALLDPGLQAVDVTDFRVPGSDHHGFAVRVAIGRWSSAAPAPTP